MTTRWLDPDQQLAWRAYIVGTTLLLERLDRDLRDNYQVSLPEYEILVRLSEAPERRLRMAELADSVKNSRSRITHTIARMEREGLVDRAQCDSDGRGVNAHLTDAGSQRLVAAAPCHVESVRACLIDLVAADDVAAVGRVFAAVADELGTGDRDPILSPASA